MQIKDNAMKKILFGLFLLNTFFLFAQDNALFQKRTQKGFLHFDYLAADMPTNDLGLDEPHMGLVGMHYNIQFNKFYTGLGFYGSVRGNRGGFFTLGVNAGLKTALTKRLFLDTGIHFGGGGGAGAPDGGGAFILPHLDLGYQFDKFAITSGYSYINFFDGGGIKSHQLHLGLQIPINFNYTTTQNKYASFSTEKLINTTWNTKAKKFSFMLHANNLSVKGSSRDTKGNSMNGATIRLAGFEINSYLNDRWFLFFKADGAYDGIPAGYMDLFVGGGYHLPLFKNSTKILAKFGVGAGGGGGVDTQGGVLVYPDISIEQRISNDLFIAVNKGFLMSPNQFFESSTLGFGLKYYANINGLKSNNKNFTQAAFKTLEVIVKQDMYINAERDTNPTEHMHQISLQLNYFLNPNIYLAGQTSFANFGNAGAYAEGIVGIGFQTNTFANDRIHLFAQGLAGGAGGGNISTGEGLILKPSIGINYKINKHLSLRSAGGYVKARGGNLSSVFLNLGLSYKLGFLSAK